MKTIGTIACTYLFILVITLFILLLVPRAHAASSSRASCRELVQEMNQMKKAQNQIIQSLAQNHDVFADQLSDLSFELALYKKTVPAKALESMEKSAQAYRVRFHKAQETAQRLDDLTVNLIEKLQACLK